MIWLLDSLRKWDLTLMLLLLHDSLKKEGGDLVEVVVLVATAFEVHERDSHVHSLMITLYRLFLLLPRAWYFKVFVHLLIGS